MLYEMLVGSTCDKGMNMENYLEMLETKGVPMPSQIRMFHQHLLSSMLQFNHQRRVGCDQVMKELQLNGGQFERQKSVVELRNTVHGHEGPHSSKPKQILFHSVIVPSDRGNMQDRNNAMERAMRS